ncbi:DUF3883 domain-containing protein [Streptosporangium sp. 'caverna']|uniref:DUF3883 domain-containing protein n=1 Tax=Streptosporangium sp. 'caverna' TaxID=2202249 RepID=UPI000D7DC84F|nr:DUF3883 domain-containing protein [Streptosporangium sp. 'caverna']AWS41691.1 hypothetical protein DKM19_10345 [Streptosporangium sp. 'caverna']
MNEQKRRTLSKSSDYLDALATTLRDLGGATTIPHELTQNADDAGNATTIRFTVTDDALTVWNNGTFTDCGEDDGNCPWPKRCDLHAFRRFAGRTKAGDASTTGAFGVGFTSVYQITDAPELLYDDEHWILDETAQEDQRLRSCDGQCARAHGGPGTTFVLPWARVASPLREKLEVPPVSDETIAEIETALLDDAHATALFLQHVTSIELETSRGRFCIEREDVEDGVVVHDTASSTRWLTIQSEFQTDARLLVKRAAGLIHPERPTMVTIAMPVDQSINSGVLYATLPTQTPSGLPANVNAAFFPSTDRKAVRFESSGYHAEWNRAAISAVARGIAEEAGRIAERLGLPAFWEFLGGITDLGRGVSIDQPNHSATYLSALRQVVPGLPVVDTIGGTRALPKNVLLPAESELYESGEALAKIGLPLVARHLHRRLYTNAMYTAYEISVLTGRNVVEQLRSKGITEAFNLSDGPLDRDELIQILDALERLPGKVANVDGIGDVAIVPCRNGMVAPPSQVVWPASGDDGTLFEVLVDDLLIADVETIETHCPGLREACSPLDVACAARILQAVDTEALGAFADNLLDWLNLNLVGITNPTTRQKVAELPIFPTASGFEPLTKLSLPNDFRDPIEVANLVAHTAARDYHKLLSALGARPLNIVDYIRLHVLPAAEAGRISISQASELLKLIAVHQEELTGLRESLASAALVPCADEQLRPAPAVHLPSPDISTLAPALPVALTTGVAPSVLEWLGVRKLPSDHALIVAVERLASGDKDPDASVVGAVLRTLQARDDLPESPPEFLTARRWLPLKRGGRAKPSEVLPTNARHLYGTQGDELGLASDLQSRFFQRLRWLGMPSAPPARTVVAHLQHCAAAESEMNPDVYRVLSNNADHQAVKQLRGTPCVYIGQGRFVLPTTAFWQKSPFGRWGTTLPEDWLQYKPFFDVVGVKHEPGPTEIAAVLQSILHEYGTDQVDQDGAEAIHGCWSRLSELLEHAEAGSVLPKLGRMRSTLDPRGLLAWPDHLFFEDSRALHKRFPQLAHNVIPRVHGTWPALAEAGVQRVEELIKAKLVDVDTRVDTELPNRIADRLSALRRVFDDEQVLDELQELTILRAARLRVSYRAELFGYSYEIGPEGADAIYLPDEDHLVYADKASDRALARELARAIAPDDDPGPLAMRLEPILSAISPQEAHLALDDFGIAKLDTTEHEASWSPTADVGDDAIVADDFVDDAPTDADAESNIGESSHGETVESEGDEAPDAKENRHGTGGGSGGGTGGGGGSGSGSGGGGKGTGERRRKGDGSDTRTGRQTRLRSYVVETDEDEGDRGAVGDEAPDLSPIDMAGVARVLEYERECGRDPHEMAHSNAGFDVESYDKRGELVRRIEIKSTGGQWSIAGVMLSRRQHQQAVKDGDLFWLYVVENAQGDDFKVYRIQNPASRIDYFGFDGGWKDVAEPDVERDESGTPNARSTRGLLGQSPGHSPTAN